MLMATKTRVAGKTKAKIAGKAKAETEAAHDYQFGDVVKFVGYRVPLPDGEEPIIEVGEMLRITGFFKDGRMYWRELLGENGEVLPNIRGGMFFPRRSSL